MIKKALDYAERMHELKIAPDTASQANDIFLAVPQVRLDFENPSVPLTAKHRVIEKVFPEKIRDFLKVLCDNDDVELWDQYYGACQCPECGKWYNLFGQSLLPPDCWEEDPSEEEYYEEW